MNIEEVNHQEMGDHLQKIFVGGLRAATNEQSLHSYFSQFGEVISVNVVREPVTQRPRGFGFVAFADATVVNVVQGRRPHTIDNKIVETKRAVSRAEAQKMKIGSSNLNKIFVGKLRQEHDSQALTDYFSAYGEVLNVRTFMDKETGRTRGFAFVEFVSYDSVEKALSQHIHRIEDSMVDVKKFTQKTDFSKQANGRQPSSAAGVWPPNNHQAMVYGPPNSMPYVYNDWALTSYPRTINYRQQQQPAGYYEQVPQPNVSNWSAAGYPNAGTPYASNIQQQPTQAQAVGLNGYAESLRGYNQYAAPATFDMTHMKNYINGYNSTSQYAGGPRRIGNDGA